MTQSPALIIGKKCRLCPKYIPLSIAPLFGSEARGYTCQDCIEKQAADLSRLGDQITEQSPEIIYSGESAPRCAMCNQYPVDDTMYLVPIDGAQGLIGGECRQKWLEKNREKLGTAALYPLGLK
jgi:hypothetical protein